MAHHVIKNTATLQLALPKPWRMRAAVLFGRARQVRTTRKRRSSVPDDLFSALDARRKNLIFEIPVQQARRFDHLNHAPRLSHVAGQWLFAGNTDKRTFS